MRQTISGVAAAIAVMTAGAAPAMACGFTACSPCGQTYSPCEQAYTPPVVNTGCNTGCGGWAHERLAEPTTQYQSYAQPAPQYYYVNQGPTYSGPGAFAPYPTYQEEAVSGWGTYRHHLHHYAMHYGFTPYRYGHRVLRRYY
jgi:hypothetical protein